MSEYDSESVDFSWFPNQPAHSFCSDFPSLPSHNVESQYPKEHHFSLKTCKSFLRSKSQSQDDLFWEYMLESDFESQATNFA